MTNDIAIGLRTPNVEAEKIKHSFGCAYSPLIEEGDNIETPSVGGREPRTVSRQVLSQILEARTREMFELLDHEINESGFREIITSGIVLTGGAAANNPMYATCTGLIQYGFKRRKMGPVRELQGRNLFDKIFSRMKDWADEFF